MYRPVVKHLLCQSLAKYTQFSKKISGSNGNSTPGSVGRLLRNDLLVAADSVTNAMSTLVRELNSGSDP